MKKTLFLLFISSCFQIYGQSVTIAPASLNNVVGLKRDGIGLDHRSSNGLIGVGTYTGATKAFIQTHTNHPLAFTTSGTGVQMILNTNGYFGIGTDSPQYLLDLTQRARIRTSGNTAGIWFSKSNNNVNEGAFFGNLSDTQTGIYIGNNWRFSVNEAGGVNIPNLAGIGTRNVGADANGNLVALAAASANTVGFSVALNSPGSVEVAGDGTPTYIHGNAEYNVGNAWNGSIFTAPSAGIYSFSVKILWQGKASGSRLIMLSKNNTDIKGTYDSPPGADPFRQQFTTTLYLNANDIIYLKITQNTGGIISAFGDIIDKSVFSGYKIN